MKKISQVFIAGCGPVGLTLAKCLALSPYIDSIILLDKKKPSHIRDHSIIPNQRVYSLNGPTLNLYKKTGILDMLRNKGQMSRIQVISKESNEYCNWSNNNAQIVENDQVVYALMKSLKQQHEDKIQFIESQVMSLQQAVDFCEVTIQNSPQPIRTKLIVGSDGNRSKIKEIAGIHTYGWSYRQRGIVCTMQIDENYPNFTGHQIYHDGNVLAILPLWNNYVSLVWSTGVPDFQHLMKLSQDQFKQKLNNVIMNANYCIHGKPDSVLIPSINKITNKRLSFPLSTLQSSFYSGNRLALVGDAAHSIHPMAGLGVNSGIMDSVYLANNIIKNIKTGNDIGDIISLSQYQAQAKAFNYKNSIAMESIKKTFEVDSILTNSLRSLGMSIFQKSDELKNISKTLVENSKTNFQWQSV